MKTLGLRSIKAFDASFSPCSCPGRGTSVGGSRAIAVTWRNAVVRVRGGSSPGWRIRCSSCGTTWLWRKPDRPCSSPGGVLYEELSIVESCRGELARVIL